MGSKHRRWRGGGGGGGAMLGEFVECADGGVSAGTWDRSIAGGEAVVAAVKQCWASLSSARTAAYLREHGIEASPVARGWWRRWSNAGRVCRVRGRRRICGNMGSIHRRWRGGGGGGEAMLGEFVECADGGVSAGT